MVDNSSDGGDLAVEAVELVDPIGLVINGGYLIPWEDNGISNGVGLPVSSAPDPFPFEKRNWEKRKPIGTAAATLEPGEMDQLVLALRPTGTDLGRSHGFIVTYWTSDGKRHRVKSETWVKVSTESSPCSSWAPSEAGSGDE
ncbi:MAG: hypothetical protein LBT54_06200 [Bifidobacteriaceae bacterium]|jgi:hypothetical protein|nr:hypothetical protein [Bifidobacteriaceae bacterium]